MQLRCFMYLHEGIQNNFETFTLLDALQDGNDKQASIFRYFCFIAITS